MKFLKGETTPSGDCGNFSAGIDVEGPGQFLAHPKSCTWFERIECYGESPASAEELRDKVLGLLLTTEHDGELHKAVFLALESYGGADTFRDGVLALVELARERYTEMMAAKDLLRDVERRILKHQATVPMSRRESCLVAKIRADIKRHLGVIK